MKSPLFAAFALTAITVAEEAPPRPAIIVEPPPSGIAAPVEVLSSSGQFRISGGEGPTRGATAILMEETYKDFVKLTGADEDWKTPVRIILHGQPGDPLPPRTSAMDLLATDTGFELRLLIHLSRGIERERFRRAATIALLYERGLRDLPPEEKETPLHVPPWLAEGLLEAHDWHARISDRRLYEVLYKHGGLHTLDQLFSVDEPRHETMDAAMRAAFRVSAGSLVMALLEQPQGQEAFRNFIKEVPPFAGEMPSLLHRHFPELNLSETSLAKWWSLQMANKGTLDLGEVFTVARTEAALSEALRLQIRDAEDIVTEHPLSPELPEIPPDGLANAVRPAQEALVRLSYRCFPSYRPLIAGYQGILGDLAQGKTTDIPERLSSLEETRAIMAGKASHARDFLDWFEITRARQTSGAFDDYLRLKDQLKYNPRRRTDDLSLYLDRMDRVFHRETGNTSPPAVFLNSAPLLPPQ